MACASQTYESIRVLRYSDETLQGDNIVQFRLLYSGQLLAASSSGNTRSSHKHAIRKEFHPQLRRVWESRKPLREYAGIKATAWVHDHPEAQIVLPGVSPFSEDAHDTDEMRELGFGHLGEKWARGGRRFIPLVTEEMCLRCSLDVLFLRPDIAGKVLQGGDIDNRLKTLFDALRLPQHSEGMGTGPIHKLNRHPVHTKTLRSFKPAGSTPRE
jgi:hypothetical protein